MQDIITVDKHSILKEVFGYNNFRGSQEDIIDHVLDRKDSLVIMPTGGGKSLCFQIPALLNEGITLVVSPLIALMNDQVAGLQQIGVKAESLHSNIEPTALKDIVNRLQNGEITILYVSPERMNNRRFQVFLKSLAIDLIAIDEAHCVSVWGNDFRPDYASLGILKSIFPKTPIIALTATADAVTQDDIITQLKLQNPKKFLSSFERENITIQARPSHQRKRQIFNFLQEHEGKSGIIYCLSRKSCEKLSADLNHAGFNANYYHAGLDGIDRNKIQKAFQDDKIQIICATIAFGMGIDKSNINWVIHYNMPKNLEGYYQEIGRSGRDGSDAHTLMFYSWGDFILLKQFIDESDANEKFKYVQNAKLQRMWEFASTTDCRTNLILNYFGEYREDGCGHCDNCLNPPEKFDGTEIAQKAISAIIRGKEIMSMSLLIDVLRGSFKQEVKSNNLHQIKTFGAGRDLPFLDWKQYITQMIDKGIIKVDYSDRMRIKTTPLSVDVVQGKKRIDLSRAENYKSINSTKKTKPKKSANERLEEELVQKLKNWRLDIAQEREVPAYVILTDRAIHQIATEKPIDLESLREVEGIGDKRLHDFGRALTSLVQDYMSEQEHKRTFKGKTYLETLRLYREGLSPEMMADRRGINISTIYHHLAHLYTKDEDIDIMQYVSEDEIDRVKLAKDKVKDEFSLSALSDMMLEPMSFNKMKLALAVLNKNGQ